VEATRIEWGGFALRADAPLTLHLERDDSGEYVLDNRSDRDGTVTVDGIGHGDAALTVAPRSRLRIAPR